MVKKILFFGIAIILGFMILVMCYSGFQMSDVQAKVTEYISNNDYESLSRCFLPYFNIDSIKQYNSGEKEVKVTSLQAVSASSITIEVNGEQEDTVKYVPGYTFYLQNFNNLGDLEAFFSGVETDGKISNYTRVVFYNGNLSYDYYFNDPITATSENAEGTNRFYTGYAEELNFVEIDLPLTTINDELAGQITKLELYGGQAVPGSDATPALSLDFSDTPLTTESQFFTLANELVEHWDAFLEDLDATKYNEFMNPESGEGWLDRYNASGNFGTSISSYNDLIGNSAIIKTVVVMVIYLVVCIVLGIFVLRNKSKMPKPYLRDRYQKQMVSANSIKAQVKEVTPDDKPVTPTETSSVDTAILPTSLPTKEKEEPNTNDEVTSVTAEEETTDNNDVDKENNHLDSESFDETDLPSKEETNLASDDDAVEDLPKDSLGEDNTNK